MKMNDMPLITPAVLKASTKNASASTQAPQVQAQAASSAAPSKDPGSKSSTTFTAEVITSRPSKQSIEQSTEQFREKDPERNNDKNTNNSKQSWQITLRSEGRNLTVQSEQPLPKGSQLTLTTDNGQPPKVDVIEIKLPVQSGSAKNTASLLQSLATQLQNTKGLTSGLTNELPAPVKDLLSSRIQWQQNTQGQASASTASSGANLVGSSSAGSLSTGLLPTVTANLLAASMRITAAYQTGAGSSDQKLNANSSHSANQTNGTSLATSTSGQLLQLLNRPLSTANVNSSSLNDALPGKLPQLAQAFVQSQPTAMQLADPTQLKSTIQNAPVRYEQQVLSLLTNTLAHHQGKPASDGITQVFKQLWAKTAPSNPATSSSRPSNSVNQQNPAGQQSSGITNETTTKGAGTTTSLSSLIAQLRGNAPLSSGLPSTTGIFNTMASAASSNSANSSITANIVMNAAVLSLLAGSQSGAAPPAINQLSGHSSDLAPMNMKGLLLNLVRQWPTDAKSHHSAQASAAQISSSQSGAAGAQSEIRGETFRLIQTALSQIEYEQVRLTQNNDQFQIPLLWRDGQQLQQALMDVKQENDDDTNNNEKTDKKHRWQITLHFDLNGLGPLDIELDLCLPGVSATFWSDRSDTLASLNQALQPLRQTLTELGADVGELKARHGRKPLGTQPIVRHSLVDVHT